MSKIKEILDNLGWNLFLANFKINGIFCGSASFSKPPVHKKGVRLIRWDACHSQEPWDPLWSDKLVICFLALEMAGEKPAGRGCGERKRMTWSQRVSHPCPNTGGEGWSLARAPHQWGAAMPGGNDTQGCSREEGSLVDSPIVGWKPATRDPVAPQWIHWSGSLWAYMYSGLSCPHKPICPQLLLWYSPSNQMEESGQREQPSKHPSWPCALFTWGWNFHR